MKIVLNKKANYMSILYFLNKKNLKTCLFFSILIASYSHLLAQQAFTDVTNQAGIKHQFNVFEGFLGGGACVFDLNNDGYDDIFIASGLSDDVLYLNNKNGTFTNVYEQSGLTGTRKYITQGAVAADVNRDGWVDLYITNITSKGEKTIIPRAPNQLYINNGNNTFRDATAEFQLDKLNSFSTGASFGDFNADGWPDLYVGNYFTEYPGDLGTVNDNMIVSANQIAQGYLLINKEGKFFKNVYEDYGLNHSGFGFGGIFTDFDNDGDQDLYVNHDFGYKRTPNILYENKYPWGQFKDVSKEMNMDLKINSMTSAVGDYNNDGWMDYFITNIRFNKFMVNQQGRGFKEMSKELGLGYIIISWGANFADFDHDGDLDLFVSNGDLNPNCQPMGNHYFENKNGKFEEKARLVGLADYGIGRGSVVFDMDNDGDLDLLVVSQRPILKYDVPTVTKLFRNDVEKGNWIKIALKGVKAESHGLGSKVEIVVAGQHMFREIDGGGSSHLSQNATYAHFGLGKATKVDEIIVHWTGGSKQVIKNVNANQMITITEEPSMGTKSKYLYGLAGVLLVIAGFLIFKSKKK